MRQNLQLICTAIRRYAKRIVCSLFLCLFFSLSLFAQKEEAPEEISLMLTLPRVGSTDIPALVKNEKAYLSIATLFDYLKIKNQLSPDMDSVTGFFLNPSTPFIISKPKNRIFYGDRYHSLQPASLLRTETDLYLRADYFGKVFGLDCEFDFRSLAVTVNTKAELPVLREMQLLAIRKNISKLKGERKADTTIGRQFHWLRLGTADWTINASQFANRIRQTRVGLQLGAYVLGGEIITNLNVMPGKPLDERMQMYRWRYVNNDNQLLRQVTVGKLGADAISTLTSAVKGFQLTNAPTTYRKSFGSYTISNTTEPGWTVELYVNNILVNYTKADASGLYTFEVPMMYGSSTIKLRFYGPWGEERTTEETVVIPFNFLPEHQFEYTLTGGLVAQEKNEQFARLNMKYGLGSFITIGGGLEYYSAVSTGRYIPYASAALRLFSKVILYGEHTYGVRSKAVLNYRHRSNLQVDINYTKYVPGQMATRFIEERKATLSMPIRSKKLSAFSRLTLSQTGGSFKENPTTAEWLISSFFSHFSTNISTLARLNKDGSSLTQSNVYMTVRLPKRLRLTQQVQYQYAKSQLSLFRTEVEKSLFRTGFLSLTYERNPLTKTNNFMVGLRFNLSGVQAGFTAMNNQGAISTFQSLRGSIMYDDNSNRLQFTNQSSAGRGGISIVPFLDLNCNGKKDPGEQKVCGMKVKMSGGRISHCSKDTTIQVTGLEAYANYLLEIDKTSFDNVAWQVRKPLVNVVADPNYLKTVEVAVAVMGEVEGKVMLQTEEGTKGQGRIIVRFFKEGKPFATTMTETDGYFNYMGFTPGQYTAELDKEQLKKVGFEAAQDTITFTIRANREGEWLSDVKFVLRKR